MNKTQNVEKLFAAIEEEGSCVVNQWLHPLPTRSTTCSLNLRTYCIAIHLELVEPDGWSPAETKGCPAQCAGGPAHTHRLWLLEEDESCLFLREEMYCRHMTIQNKPNMSCLHVRGPWFPRIYHFEIKVTLCYQSYSFKNVLYSGLFAQNYTCSEFMAANESTADVMQCILGRLPPSTHRS